MASYGKRIDPISAESRHQVLRPGVRIVADQFGPRDDGPFQEEVDEEDDRLLKKGFQQMTVYLRGHTFTGRVSSFHAFFDESIKESMRVAEEAERKKREKMKKLEEAAGKALSNHFSSGTAIDTNVLRVAPLPKLGSDHEPYYVRLTRPKKRR